MRTGAGVRSDDHLILRADGSRFRASYTAAAVRRDGCVIGAVLALHGITERGAAEDDGSARRCPEPRRDAAAINAAPG
jgi:hypothetical protein